MDSYPFMNKHGYSNNMDESLKAHLQRMLPNNGRILPSQLQSLAQGLTSSSSHSGPQSLLDGIPSLGSPMGLDIAAMLQRRAQAEEQVRLELMARAAGLHRSLPKPLPNSSQSFNAWNHQLLGHDAKLISSGPLRKRRQLSDAGIATKRADAIVINLRRAERKAHFPLPAVSGEGWLPRRGSLASFHKTWEKLEEKVKARGKLQPDIQEQLTSELFRRSLHRRNMDHLYRKVHGLTSKDAPGSPPKKRKVQAAEDLEGNIDAR
jgi:hypothetical protein